MLGVTVEDTNVYVIMELCEGGSLSSLMEKTQLNQEEKLHIISTLASGVQHLHANGIIHRDLAARNILLSADNEAKISDFGMSRMVDKFERANVTTSSIGPVKVRRAMPAWG